MCIRLELVLTVIDNGVKMLCVFVSLMFWRVGLKNWKRKWKVEVVIDDVY